MTSYEFSLLVKGMKSVYTSPNFLPDAEAIKMWFALLGDLDYNIANIAIQKYMLNGKYPPTIADIRELATAVKTGDIPLWSDGWEETLRAIRKYGSYRENEALESMSEITRMTVQRLGFRNICMSDNITAERANFRDIYNELAERKQREVRLPVNLSNLIEQVRGNLMIEGKT